MIAKGKPRAGPAQLASYLLRVYTSDGPQRVEVLELQSGNDTLREAFLDWHSVGLGTRGEKTLYHAQISPAPGYAMTPEQWKRAADILGEELGLTNHPRAIVLHDDGDHPHMHIVWQRADVETMTMWDDSYNFVKHERASLRMELEFGQEFVPGKHAKRDREQQPEFPRAESTQEDQQQAQRTELTFEERKEQITGIRQSADNAQAFKNALEENGYVLAKGDTRGFVVIDEAGEVFSLSKYVADLKNKAYEKFMAPIDRDQLPSVEEAKALQEQRALKARQEAAQASPPSAPEAPSQPPEPVKRTGEELREFKAQLARIKAEADSAQAFKNALEKAGYVLANGERGYTVVDENGADYNLARQLTLKLAAVNEFMSAIDLKTLPSIEEAAALQRGRALNAQKQPPEASKFLPPELAQQIEQPTPSPAQAEKQPSSPAAPENDAEASKFLPQPSAQQHPAPPPEDPELQAIKKALEERHAIEVQKFADLHALEFRQLDYELTKLNDASAKLFAADQAAIMDALKDRLKQERKGIKGILDAIESKLHPTLAAEKAQERRREIAQLKARQQQELKDYLALIEQSKQLEIENLKERQALQRSDQERRYEGEIETRTSEHHEAKRIQAEIEARRIHEELEKEQKFKDGPPPPKLGK